MTQEFLNDFGVFSIGIQDRPERMTKVCQPMRFRKPICSLADVPPEFVISAGSEALLSGFISPNK
jgi:hypothetical protein